MTINTVLILQVCIFPHAVTESQEWQILWAYHTAQVVRPSLRDVGEWKNPEIPVIHTRQSQLFIARHGLQDRL